MAAFKCAMLIGEQNNKRQLYYCEIGHLYQIIRISAAARFQANIYCVCDNCYLLCAETQALDFGARELEYLMKCIYNVWKSQVLFL